MEERFSPQMFVNYYISQQGISVEDIGVGSLVVISWSKSVIESLAGKTGAKFSDHWFYHQRNPLYSTTIHGQRVSFLRAPVGAAGTIMMMEEMIACGAHNFLGLGWAGSLQPSAPIGTLLVPTKCICEEGTSRHYLDNQVTTSPDNRLAQLMQIAAKTEGMEAVAGSQWTTDAPYRETHAKIETYARQGVLGVDMETSAMYALGQFRGVSVCNLLVVSDELWHAWRPAFGSVELEAATACAQQVILRSLESLVDNSGGQASQAGDSK
jgi:uridine phosphorylase